MPPKKFDNNDPSVEEDKFVLSSEEFWKKYRHYVRTLDDGDVSPEDLAWKLVEEDRSKKFFLGEKVEIQARDTCGELVWVPATILAVDRNHLLFRSVSDEVRHVEYKTREEKIHDIKSYLQTPTEKIWEKLDDKTLDTLLASANISLRRES